ncbi:MAG: hypothetical protein L6R37_004712 [Teloschistes peruensis]|nr:MAG: hypothetical protein L6R37_004712 [Teloschistes peruensis]
MPALWGTETSICILKTLLVCLTVSLSFYVVLQVGRFNALLPTSKVPRSNKKVRCGFNGDADIYGIGIRIGYYTQALSGWFANYFVARLSSTLRSVNSLFMFALLVGLLWLSRAPSQMFAIEAWLLIQLLATTGFVAVISPSRYGRKYQRFDPVRSIIQTITVFFLWGYMTWYYWFGLDRMKKTPCGTYVLFFVAKMDLFGWCRTFAKAFLFLPVCKGTLDLAGVSIKITHHYCTRHLRSPAFILRLSTELRREEIAAENSLIPDPNQPLRTNHCILPRMKTSDLGIGDDSESQNPQAEAEESRIQEADSIFETAKRTPLPPSPSVAFHQSPPLSSSTADIIPEVETSSLVPTLSSLLVADAYIDSVLDGFEQRNVFSTYRIPYIPIRIVRPKIQWITPAYTRNILTHLFCHRPGIFGPILIHTWETRTNAHTLFVDIFNTAVDHPDYHTISTDALNVVLVFRMLRQPHSKPRYWCVNYAVLSLVVCLLCVVSIELGIAWNRIDGLGDVGKVGQLVPVVLGVGGLVKVGWTRWRERRVGNDDKLDMEIEWVNEGMKRCAELYEKLRETKAAQVREGNPPDRLGTV